MGEQASTAKIRGQLARSLEAASLFALLVLQCLGWARFANEGAPWLWLLAAVPLAWLGADLASGLVHFCADNFGSEGTPIIGKLFVAPFREHHQDPDALLRHDFLERNGNNSMIAALVLLWVPFIELQQGLLLLLQLASLLLSLFVAGTNQVHAWAHSKQPPALVRAIQRAGLVLSPEQHQKHHAPFEAQLKQGKSAAENQPFQGGYYCITSGVCDRLMSLFR